MEITNVTPILTKLAKHYPQAQCSLLHKNPYQLLFATILSAQCTDARVNMVTPALFKKYPTVQTMAKAKQKDVEKLVQSTGFYRNKAKNIIGAAKKIVADFDGKVPEHVDELILLPGVARKTANVVSGNAFGNAEGIVIDTHAIRLSNRFKWVNTKNPVQIEKELVKIIPKKHWIIASHWFVFHGRAYCRARKPNCADCFLNKVCPSAGKV